MSTDERRAVVRFKGQFGCNEVYGLCGDDAKIFTPAQAEKIASKLWAESGLFANARVYASYAEAVKHLNVSSTRAFA